MATNIKDSFNPSTLPLDGKGYKIGILISQWNDAITNQLAHGAISKLIELGVNEHDIYKHYVPGSFELPLGASYLLSNTDADAVICLGCVIQGETKHFDYVCEGATHGIMNVNLEFKKPVVFGVLTTNTIEQAQDRAGGKHGNKGIDCAYTAIQMLTLKQTLIKQNK